MQNLTIRGIYVCDISIVCGFSCPEVYSRGAAESDGTEMLLECQTLLDQMFLNKRLIGQRVKVDVLVISQEEDYIGFRIPGIAARQRKLRGTRGSIQCKCSSRDNDERCDNCGER